MAVYPPEPVAIKDKNGTTTVSQQNEVSLFIGYFTDETGAEIDSAGLLTLTLTLFDDESGTVINNRINQSIKDENNGSLSADGKLTLRLQKEDNIIVDSNLAANQIEKHIVRLEYSWRDLTEEIREKIKEFYYYVQKGRAVS